MINADFHLKRSDGGEILGDCCAIWDSGFDWRSNHQASQSKVAMLGYNQASVEIAFSTRNSETYYNLNYRGEIKRCLAQPRKPGGRVSVIGSLKTPK
jgi:hypothetical protein